MALFTKGSVKSRNSTVVGAPVKSNPDDYELAGI